MEVEYKSSPDHQCEHKAGFYLFFAFKFLILQKIRRVHFDNIHSHAFKLSKLGKYLGRILLQIIQLLFLTFDQHRCHQKASQICTGCLNF